MAVYKRAWRVVEDDCIEAMRRMTAESFHAVITDPPYGLSFMGKGWDHGAPDVSYWSEALRVLKPGGYLLAFGGTRTFHRLACAIEDAGFEIRDCLSWMYGTGFPKSHDVSKAIDKVGGNPLAWRAFAKFYAATVESSAFTHADIDRYLGVKSSSCYWARQDHRGGMPPRHHFDMVVSLLNLRADYAETFRRLYDEAERADRDVSGYAGNSVHSPTVRVLNSGTPVTDAARTWHGYGTALKPSFEPIVWAMKPLTAVPLAAILAEVSELLGALLCLAFDARRADPSFTSSLPELPEGTSASVAQLAALNHGAARGASFEAMGTCSSPEMASTCLNIATSWSAILDAIYRRPSTFTTRTETALTIVCETLRSCISQAIPENIIRAACSPDGFKSSAATARRSSRGGRVSRNVTPTATARALVSWRRNVSGTSVEGAAKRSRATILVASSVLGPVIRSIDVTDLVPNWEPIILARKPLAGTVAANCLEHGTGALNIDGCRVEGEVPTTVQGQSRRQGEVYGRDQRDQREFVPHGSGRWPANVVLECICDGPVAVPETVRDRQDEVSQERRYTRRGASDFAAKPGRRRSGGGLVHTNPGCPAAMLDEQSGTLRARGNKTPTKRGQAVATDFMSGGTSQTDPGDSGGASRFFYCAKASKKERGEGNNHPTVKPVELMRWLVRLVKSPGDTRILDPFAGSGTTGVAALAEGVRCVLVEKEAEYAETVRERLRAVDEERRGVVCMNASNGRARKKKRRRR